MTSAAAIIDALNSRDTPRARLRQAARESWAQWLDRLAQTPGRVTGAPADALVRLMMAREPAAAPPRADALGRWQAFATLWRQQWQPASRDERRWRWAAGGVSFGWHVLVVVLLLIVTALRPTFAPPPEDDAVQVEYVGRGTPAESGGGDAPPAASGAASPSAARAASGTAAPSGAAAATPAAAEPVASRTPPEAQPTPATPPQPVQVSKPVSSEPPTFVLPPTTLPTPRTEVARTAPPEVQVREVPVAPTAPRLEARPMRVEVLRREPDAPAIAVREVPVLDAPRIPAARIPDRVDVPRPAMPAPEVAVRDVPVRASAPASPAPAASASSTSTASTATSTPTAAPGTAAASTSATASAATAAGRTGTAPAAAPATARPGSGVGAGPKTTPSPGSWATPNRGDDWGDSTRNRPGNSLFDGDGRPRVAEGPGSASAPHPPGLVTDEIRDIDRAGTWLRRKPFPYEPSRWDRLWRPNETLLQEWVRKGIKQVGIPVPGTSKTITCVISILQLGGGCGIDDPNLQDQPARARPAPNVPFKPHLQEGNGATPGAGGTSTPPLPGLFAPPKAGTAPGAVPESD